MNQLHTNWLRDWTVHPIPLSFSTGAIIDPPLQFPRSASDTSAAHLGSLSLSLSPSILSLLKQFARCTILRYRRRQGPTVPTRSVPSLTVQEGDFISDGFPPRKGTEGRGQKWLPNLQTASSLSLLCAFHFHWTLHSSRLMFPRSWSEGDISVINLFTESVTVSSVARTSGMYHWANQPLCQANSNSNGWLR